LAIYLKGPVSGELAMPENEETKPRKDRYAPKPGEETATASNLAHLPKEGETVKPVDANKLNVTDVGRKAAAGQPKYHKDYSGNGDESPKNP
jgi:hypothetical protein